MAKIGKLIEQCCEHLDVGELILATVQGNYDGGPMGDKQSRPGILAATSQRLVFYGKRLGGFDFESFPYANIASFEQGKNLMGHTVRFTVLGNDVALKWISDGTALAAFAKVVRERVSTAQRGAVSSAATPSSTVSVFPGTEDIAEQIRQLGRLRDEGLLTDDEFVAKKTQLLDRL